VTVIRSRDNPRVKRWAKLSTDARFRREEQRLFIEGPHLVGEALRAGLEPLALIVSETGLNRPELWALAKNLEPVVLSDSIFRALADAETPPGIAAEIELSTIEPDTAKPAVFLEGVQDPSNVGAILRSAAAFGVGEVVLDRACADAWSPKALRAGMGGHFRLAVEQVTDLAPSLEAFSGTVICTLARAGKPLKTLELKGRLGWIFGAEGRGVSESSAARAGVKATIPMASGSESINVAAAAAICLYEGYLRANSGSGS
jgi:TrmH family RNA methyltransferase